MLRTWLIIFCLGYLSLASSAQISIIGKTPQNDTNYAQGVSGHAATLLKHPKGDKLIMLGGCNFPAQPAAEGGAKHYYNEIYASPYRFKKSIKSWSLIGRLPEAFAYAAYQNYNNKLIIAGGKNNQRELDRTYLISLDNQGKLLIDTLPNLPEPRSSMASAIAGSRLYLIGGTVSGVLSNSVISLDLENPKAGWRDEAHYLGLPALKVLSANLKTDKGNKIYLFSSFVNTQSSTDSVETQAKLMSYDPRLNTWQLELEYEPSEYNGYTFGGGHIYANSKEQTLTLIGGVSEQRFLPALIREQKMKQARNLKDEKTLGIYQKEVKEYLLQAKEWYQFSPTLLFIPAEHEATGISLSLEPSEDLAKADGALVEIKPGHWLLLGGEVKPGIRTADIVY